VRESDLGLPARSLQPSTDGHLRSKKGLAEEENLEPSKSR